MISFIAVKMLVHPRLHYQVQTSDCSNPEMVAHTAVMQL
jgi:hypothetical protein